MDLKISIDDEVYNHFLNNNYTRDDVMAIHAALNNAEPHIIAEAYLRANSIDAVRGLAYRKGHIREAEELDMARMTILELVDYIKKKEDTNESRWNYELWETKCLNKLQTERKKEEEK